MQGQTTSVVLLHVRAGFHDLVGEQNRGLDLPFPHAGRTGLHDLYFHGRTNALACDLHQSEFTERQHVVFGAVTVHEFTHIVIQLLLVLFGIHVDEINDDDSAYIP